MMESLRILSFTFGSNGATLGALEGYVTTPYGFTLIGVAGAPSANDTDLTMDINDDGSVIVTAMSMAVKATPGTWLTPALGGTNTSVHVAAESVLSFDFNNAAANTQVYVQLYVLLDEVHV